MEGRAGCASPGSRGVGAHQAGALRPHSPAQDPGRQAVHVGCDPSPEDGPAGRAIHMCEVRAIEINILGQAKARLIKNRECDDR